MRLILLRLNLNIFSNIMQILHYGFMDKYNYLFIMPNVWQSLKWSKKNGCQFRKNLHTELI